MSTVSTIAAAITTQAPVSHGPDSGRTNSPIATRLHQRLELAAAAGRDDAACRSTANRSTVTPISRTRISTVTHHGSSPSIDRPISAAPISVLSAIGSANLPNSVSMP